MADVGIAANIQSVCIAANEFEFRQAEFYCNDLTLRAFRSSKTWHLGKFLSTIPKQYLNRL